MKLLVSSIGPLLADFDQGGSQKVLRLLCQWLGHRGHEIRVLCSGRTCLPGVLELSENVSVYPSLDFRQPFPDPYRVDTRSLLSILKSFEVHLNWADVVYSHDSGMFGLDEIWDGPLIQSVRDFAYSESLRGLLEFKRDVLIVNSVFAARVVKAMLSRKIGINGRLHFIENPLEHHASRNKGTPSRFVALWPHRTEEDKGIHFCIRSFARFVHTGAVDAELWITKWFDESEQDGACFRDAMVMAQDLGIELNIRILPWLKTVELRAKYSEASVVICTSLHPEPFSNVWLEAIGSEVPVIALDTQCFHDEFLDQGTLHVQYGDDESFCECLHTVALGSFRLPSSLSEQVSERHSIERVGSKFENLIVNTRRLDPLVWHVTPEQSVFELAPWITVGDTWVFDLMRKKYIPAKIALTNSLRKGVKFDRNEIVRLQNHGGREDWFVPATE